MALLADKGEDEIVTPVSKIKAAEQTRGLVGRERQQSPAIAFKPYALSRVKNQEKALSQLHADSIMENTELKHLNTSTGDKEQSQPGPPSIINNNTTNNGNNSSDGPSQGFGGGTKATESMGLQTQYPIWRRGFG